MTGPAPLQVAVIGCGNRGADVYARHLTEQGARIVALAEPRPERLAEVAARHGVPRERQYRRWQDLYRTAPPVDAVVIATPDHAHLAPCLEALARNLHVLLEKPVAATLSELDALQQAEAASTGRVTVCHVLRATPFFRAVKRTLDSGALGQLIAVTLAENVAHWHYAHSYVRGNWRASPPAAPFLLAKSVHDLDLLRWYAGSPPERVHRVGALRHFRPGHAPAGAAARCLDCAVTGCPSDARQIYLTRPADRWPVTVLTAGGVTLDDALRHGPYGECVYLGRNNVHDHEAVTIEFQGGVTAQLTVSAFTHNNTRTIKLLGSHGELRGHMQRGELELHDFRTGHTRTWTEDVQGNHGGGDRALVRDWLAFLRGQGAVPTPLSESLDSHRMALL